MALAVSESTQKAQRLDVAEQALKHYHFPGLVIRSRPARWDHDYTNHWEIHLQAAPAANPDSGSTITIHFAVRFRPGTSEIDEIFAMTPGGNFIGAAQDEPTPENW